MLVEDGWVSHLHGSPGPFMTVLCWAQMAVLWRLLFSGLKPHSLFLVLACCMTWVHQYNSTSFIFIFLQLFLWYQLLCLPWIKLINVCFHYAAMGFAEWENMRWTQLSMKHSCWLHTRAKMISDLADEFHTSYFFLIRFYVYLFLWGFQVINRTADRDTDKVRWSGEFATHDWCSYKINNNSNN